MKDITEILSRLIRQTESTPLINSTDEADGHKKGSINSPSNHELPSGGKEAAGEEQSSESRATRKTWKQQVLGSVMVAGTACGFVASLASVQLLQSTIPHAELNVFRFLLQPVLSLLLYASVHCKGTHSLLVPKHSVPWVFLFSVVNNFSNIAVYGMRYYLPLGTSAGLSMSTETTFAFIVGLFVFRQLKPNVLLSVIITLTAAVLITQPAFLFGDLVPLTSNLSLSLPPNISDLPAVWSIACPIFPIKTSLIDNITLLNASSPTDGLLSALSDTAIGYILAVIAGVCLTTQSFLLHTKLSDVSIFALHLWAPIGAIVLSAIQAALSETLVFPTFAICIILLVIHCVSASVSIFFWWWGNQLIEPVLAVLILHAVDIPGNFVLQYTVMAEVMPGKSNIYEVVGASLLLLALFVGPIMEIIVNCIVSRKAFDIENSSGIKKCGHCM